LTYKITYCVVCDRSCTGIFCNHCYYRRDFYPTIHQKPFGGRAPFDPLGELERPPDPLAAKQEAYFKGRGREGREGNRMGGVERREKEGTGKEGNGKGKGWRKGEGEGRGGEKGGRKPP